MLTHIWPIILGRRKHRLLGKILADEKDEGAKYWLGPAGEGSSRGTMAQSAGNPKNPDPPQFIILPHHRCWIPIEHYCAHITLAPLTVFQCSFKGNEHSVGICSVRFIVHHPPLLLPFKCQQMALLEYHRVPSSLHHRLCHPGWHMLFVNCYFQKEVPSTIFAISHHNFFGNLLRAWWQVDINSLQLLDNM